MSLLHVVEMEREADRNGGAFVGRAEIDTRAPFRSVKEAVMLFGEKVLAGEIANRLNEMRATANRYEQSAPRLSSIVAELEETKQNLEKSHEERLEMVNYLTSLKLELEKTKTELKLLKAREREKPAIDSEIEDIKFVENATAVEIERQVMKDEDMAFQRKKYVKFANPPSLARVMSTEEQVVDRRFSMNKENSQMRNKQKKKRSLFPMIASMFLKKKSYHGEASVQAHGMQRVA